MFAFLKTVKLAAKLTHVESRESMVIVSEKFNSRKCCHAKLLL